MRLVNQHDTLLFASGPGGKSGPLNDTDADVGVDVDDITCVYIFGTKIFLQFYVPLVGTKSIFVPSPISRMPEG